MRISITQNNRKSGGRIERILRKLLVCVFWIGVWQLIYSMVRKDALVASPVQTVRTLAELVGQSEFWLSVGNSLFRVFAGFLTAVAAGILLAVLTSRFPLAHDIFTPAIGIIRATPVVSFIILAIVWLNEDFVSVFIAFLMVLPVIWANISEGIARTDRQLLEMGAVFHFSRVKMLRSIYIPSVMPYFIAAVTTGIGFAWKAGVAAEVIGVPLYSIGRHLYDAKIYLETADLFAWTAAVILMSMLAEHALINLIGRIGKKYNVRENNQENSRESGDGRS